MKDVIDLGNLVFDRLVSSHGESQDSRILFLYDITINCKWNLSNSKDHWLLIDETGITKNFNDQVLDSLQKQWTTLKEQTENSKLNKKIEAMRSEFDRPAPKDGDLWEFGHSCVDVSSTIIL